jgi:hypothetical protein
MVGTMSESPTTSQAVWMSTIAVRTVPRMVADHGNSSTQNGLLATLLRGNVSGFSNPDRGTIF